MRSCPICDHTGKRVIMNGYCGTSMANAEVKSMCLFECTRCGHRYLDGLHLSQAWFDDYYLNRYRTDDKPYSDERLASLAFCVSSNIKLYALDIGGMDLELQNRLSKHGIVCDVAGVGDVETKKYEGVILSHTLEHIYNIPAMFDRIKAALIPNGLLFVEVPIHLGYLEASHLGYKEPTEYDLHWQHIQKFRPQDLESLFQRNGFTITESYQLPNYREYQTWRIVGRLCE